MSITAPSCPLPSGISITRVGTLSTDLGECPAWHDGRLWLLDCRRGLVLALDANDGRVMTSLALPPPLGSFAFDESGCLVVALKEQVVALDPRTAQWRTLASLDISHPHLRLNDGCALPDGSFVVGTMHPLRQPGEPPLGGVYRLGHDLQLRRLAEGVAIANGPTVSPVNGRFHLADSEARTLHSWHLLPDGSLTDRRLLVDTAPWGSGPDGCCFDDQGGLWTALVRASALARFDANGQLTHWIALSLTYPTALCFGEASMDTLFVTSIRDSGRLRADGPLDGAVLRVAGTGFRGQPRPKTRLGLALDGGPEPVSSGPANGLRR
jgi:L-arabinonolactonase